MDTDSQQVRQYFERIRYVNMDTPSRVSRTLAKIRPADAKVEFIWPWFAHHAVMTDWRSRVKYVALGVGSFVLAIAVLVGIHLVTDYNLSPMTQLKMWLAGFVPLWLASVVTAIGFLATLVFARPMYSFNKEQSSAMNDKPTKFGLYNVLLRFALVEELVFRAGSEKLSWPRRMAMSVMFGLVHVYFIYLYPPTVVVIMVLGLFLTIVYLRVYKKSDSALKATAAASVVHAIFNVAAVFWLVIVLLLAIV